MYRLVHIIYNLYHSQIVSNHSIQYPLHHQRI